MIMLRGPKKGHSLAHTTHTEQPIVQKLSNFICERGGGIGAKTKTKIHYQRSRKFRVERLRKVIRFLQFLHLILTQFKGLSVFLGPNGLLFEL